MFINSTSYNLERIIIHLPT